MLKYSKEVISMNIYDFNVLNIEGKSINLSDYKGQTVLVINSATHCGLTPQYEPLQKLYETYKDKGFVILDFPCNQFMNQAPEDEKGIKKFCELNYQTTFPQFSKIKVNGKDAHPLYKYLKRSAPLEYSSPSKQQGWFNKIIFGTKIKWNFTKFLIDKNGQIVARFSPGFKPEGMKPFIEDIL